MMVSRDRDLDEADWRAFAQGVGTQIGQVLTLAGAYADLEAAERKAEAHAAVLGAVFESAPDYVVQLDRGGLIRFINRVEPPAKPDDLLGQSWFDRIAPDQRDRAHQAFDSVIASGVAQEIELHVMRADHSSGFFQCRIGAVKQDGSATGCVIIARDVTDKKQTEMQLMLADRMASVGTLAAGVAHEINNPLAAVIANLDMAEHDIRELGTTTKLPPDLVDEVHDARASADRVREIVRDLKVFSRAQEDRRGAVDVEKVLESTLRMAWNELRHRARVVKTYGKVPRVDANEGRLGQVFLNLIVNAVQAIPEGNYDRNEIRITTRMEHGQVASDRAIPARASRRTCSAGCSRRSSRPSRPASAPASASRSRTASSRRSAARSRRDRGRQGHHVQGVVAGRADQRAARDAEDAVAASGGAPRQRARDRRRRRARPGDQRYLSRSTTSRSRDDCARARSRSSRRRALRRRSCAT